MIELCFELARFFGISPAEVLSLPHSERELWVRQAHRLKEQDEEASHG